MNYDSFFSVATINYRSVLLLSFDTIQSLHLIVIHSLVGLADVGAQKSLYWVASASTVVLSKVERDDVNGEKKNNDINYHITIYTSYDHHFIGYHYGMRYLCVGPSNNNSSHKLYGMTTAWPSILITYLIDRSSSFFIFVFLVLQ
jgi:hypothetical protein